MKSEDYQHCFNFSLLIIVLRAGNNGYNMKVPTKNLAKKYRKFVNKSLKNEI